LNGINAACAQTATNLVLVQLLLITIAPASMSNDIALFGPYRVQDHLSLNLLFSAVWNNAIGSWLVLPGRRPCLLPEELFLTKRLMRYAGAGQSMHKFYLGQTVEYGSFRGVQTPRGAGLVTVKPPERDGLRRREAGRPASLFPLRWMQHGPAGQH
jgi:hypothetical protein